MRLPILGAASSAPDLSHCVSQILVRFGAQCVLIVAQVVQALRLGATISVDHELLE